VTGETDIFSRIFEVPFVGPLLGILLLIVVVILGYWSRDILRPGWGMRPRQWVDEWKRWTVGRVAVIVLLLFFLSLGVCLGVLEFAGLSK
jgi:uncharacterized membrane protein